MKISGCIIAQNEAHCIEQAVLSLKQFAIIDEIVVVDGGSVDNTVAICEQLGCKVVVNEWQYDFSLQRNFAMSLCKNDWIVFIDADEWLPEKTVWALSKLLPSIPDRYGAVKLLEITELLHNGADPGPVNPLDLDQYYPGYSQLKNKHEVSLPGVYADCKTIVLTHSFRVLNKFKGKWVGKVHETFALDASYQCYVLPYKYAIHHQKTLADQHTSNSRYFYLEKSNAFAYEIEYDDFIGGESRKSVTTLDKIFTQLVTEIVPCDCFVEAGAFTGDTSRLVESILPNAAIYAFEANPYNYEQFKPLFESSAVNYVHLAVSDKNGTVTFKVQKNNNGTDMPPVKGNDSILSRTEPNVEYEEFVVPCVTIDNYLADKIKTTDSIAMWVDLEGAAYQALQGAVHVLPQVDIIKIEVETRQYWENQKLDHDIKKFLSHFGFYPVLRDFEYQNQYNILFCKQHVFEKQEFITLAKQYNMQNTVRLWSGE
jgi:FkbM family methyltransferase